jgi:hypothetical protein
MEKVEHNYADDGSIGIPKVIMLAKIAPGFKREEQEEVLTRALLEGDIKEYADPKGNILYTYRSVQVGKRTGTEHRSGIVDGSDISASKAIKVLKKLEALEWNFDAAPQEQKALEDQRVIPDKMKHVLQEALEASKGVYKTAEVIHDKLKTLADLSQTGAECRDKMFEGMQAVKEDEHVYHKMLTFLKDKNNEALTVNSCKEFLAEGGGRLKDLRDTCKMTKVFIPSQVKPKA